MSAAMWVRLNVIGNRFASRAAVREWFNTAAVLAAIVGLYTITGTMDYQDALRSEASRLHARLQFAHEQGVMRSDEYGMRFNQQSYRLMRYTKNKWVDITDDKLLLPHTLPETMRLQLELEGISAVLEENDDEQLKDPEKEIKPQVFLLSSGETTPDFEVRIRISGSESSKALHGDIICNGILFEVGRTRRIITGCLNESSHGDSDDGHGDEDFNESETAVVC